MKNIYLVILVPLLGLHMLFAESTFTRVGGNEPLILNPANSSNSIANNIIRDLFEPLMSRDAKGNVILGQAKSYTIDKTKTIYTFTLRDDAKWSDGSEVTAYDFEYAYKLMADPKNHAIYSFFLTTLNIKNAKEVIEGNKSLKELGIKVINNKKLTIMLEKPTYYFLEGLSSSCMAPISKKLYPKNIPILSLENTISNGAYLLEGWERNKKIILKKNPYYYDAKNIKIDKINYLFTDKESYAFKLYQDGLADYVDEIPKNKYLQLIKKYPKSLINANILGTFYLSFNTKKVPFNNLSLRKALSYAIDRERITKKTMNTGEKPLYSFLPKGFQSYTPLIPEYQKWTQKQREIEARILLNNAGFTHQNPLRFELLYNKNEQNTRVLLSIVKMWKHIFTKSISVKLKSMDWNAYQKNKSSYGVVRLGWIADINDPLDMFSLFTKSHPYNHASYHNKLFSQKLLKAQSIEDLQERVKIYTTLEKILVDDMPVIPIFQFTSSRLIKSYVKGYKSTPLDTVFSKYLFIEK